jgi:hypothetical protein
MSVKPNKSNKQRSHYENKARSRKQRSEVWKHFIKVQPFQGQCKLCKVVLPIPKGGATTGLWGHLSSKHDFVGHKSPQKLPNNNTIDKTFARVELTTEQQSVIDEALIDWIAGSNQPFQVVECIEFRNFCGRLNSKYACPTASTATKLFDIRFEFLIPWIYGSQ